MISFRQFLVEIKSRKQALKDLGRGSFFMSDTIPHRRRDYSVNVPDLNKHYNHLTDVKKKKQDKQIVKDIASRVMSVPLDKVHSSQGWVNRDSLRKKIKGDKRNTPRIPVAVQKKDGSFDLVDGNHRVTARKFRGFSHIRAAVYKEE